MASRNTAVQILPLLWLSRGTAGRSIPIREDMLQDVIKPDAQKLGAFVATEGSFLKRYPTISFEGAFSINYYFEPAYPVSVDMTLYVWDQTAYESASVLTEENASQILTMTAGTEYTASVAGIAAKDLDKTVYVAAVYSDGIVTHCSGVIAYSIGAYCKSQISQGTAAMQELAATVAVYGYYTKAYFA